MTKKKIFTILFLIVLFGAFLRIYRLGETSFSADEFLDINASYGYFKTGQWQAWDFNMNAPAERINTASDQRAWIYRWQVAKLFDFLPPTEETARLVSFAWGVLTIILMYWVAKYFTQDVKIALLSAFLFAISLSGIEFDRRLRMYAMFFPAFLLFSWFLFRFLEEKYSSTISVVKKIQEKLGINIVYFIPVIILGSLSLHLHELSANIALIMLVYFLINAVLLWRKGISLKNKYASYLMFIGFATVVMFVFERKIVVHYLGGLEFFNNNFSYLGKIFFDYSHPLIAAILIFIGYYFLYTKEETKKASIWLLASFLSVLLAAIFLWKRNVGPQYIFFIQSFEIILIASGIYFVSKFLGEKVSGYGKKSFLIPLIILLLVVPNYAYFFTENNFYHQNSQAENPNYRKVFAYIKKNKNQSDVLITRDFRNYYLSGEEMKIYDFGGELSNEKFSLDELEKITKDHSGGWFVFADNDEDYISPVVETYVRENMEKINDIQVRGKISVYRWNKKMSN